MQLSYRGINYNQEPIVIDSHQVKATGKYRGKNIELHKFNNIRLQNRHNPMTYRGVSYN